MNENFFGRVLFNLNRTLFFLFLPSAIFEAVKSVINAHVLWVFVISSLFLPVSYFIEKKVSLIAYLNNKFNQCIYFLFGFGFLAVFLFSDLYGRDRKLILLALGAYFFVFFSIQAGAYDDQKENDKKWAE